MGTDEEQKMLKIGKTCNKKERDDMLKLLTEYKDVIAWSYEELRNYDHEIITHDISLKLNAKPFRQRQQ